MTCVKSESKWAGQACMHVWRTQAGLLNGFLGRREVEGRGEEGCALGDFPHLAAKNSG